jgi:hypothetical protein
MDQPTKSADQPARSDAAVPTYDDPQLGLRRRPRTAGDQAAMPQVRLALALFLLFLFLLVLWMVWPFLVR